MRDRWRKASPGTATEPGPDAALSEALRALDPQTLDANYWLRFRDWVLSSAAPELARRRLVADITVGDVMSSWARAVIPTAVLAAALAGVLIVKGQVGQAPPPVRLEELLSADLEHPTVPADLRLDEAGGAVAFAEESF